MKRYLALLVALLLAALMFSACNDGPADPPPPAESSAPETDAPVSDLVIVENGSAKFPLIRADEAHSAEINAVSQLAKAIETATGVYPELSTDWIKPGEAYIPHTYEILVGRTAYPQSKQVLENLPYGDFVIAAMGNKLVINAWSPEGIQAAVNTLTEMIITSAENGRLALPGDLYLSGTAVKSLNTLPAYAQADPSNILCIDEADYLLVFPDATSDTYTAYCKTLTEGGFTLYTENAITDNRFATYTTEDYTLTAGYYAYNNEIRLIIEPRNLLPALQSDKVATGPMVPSFVFFGLGEEEDYRGGQSMLWQLSDGSYIVVDGGYNLADNARQLYAHMRDNAPDPNNITVAAWILTHPHGDHHGTFLQFCKLYANRIKVEMFMGNFPGNDVREAGGLSDGMSSTRIISYMTENFPGVPFLKNRVGQELYIRDAKIEILYTLDSYLPRTLTYLNTSSLIFTMEIGGQRFLITGDASQDACLITHSMYGDYLKSDYVQIAHHGAGVGSSSIKGLTSLYSAAEAPVVLWPSSVHAYNAYRANAHNAHALKLESTKEIIVAGDRVFRVALPYTPGTSEQETILK